MNGVRTLTSRLQTLGERVNRLTLRERAMVFLAAVALLGMAWQMLLMDPLTRRAHTAQQQLQGVRERLELADQAARSAAASPVALAATRNHALEARLAQLDAQLTAAAQGYVAPEKVADLVGELIARQQGLTLISLRNRPVQSLAVRTTLEGTGESSTADARTVPHAATQGPAPHDRGPFLHPVELEFSGDYPSIVRYLQALEQLPFRLHWERLELRTLRYPENHVRLVIGALSLSRDWMSV